MTCIIGLAHEGKVYLAGDSAGVAGYDLQISKTPKVFVNGPFLIGYTASFRMGQLLEHAFAPPKRHPDMDVMRFMVTDFVDTVRNCFKNGGFAWRQNEAEKAGFFLVAYEGRLFEIQEDYQVFESRTGIAAVGYGNQVALGAMYALHDKPPEERVTAALAIVERCSAGVAGPFHVVSL